MKINDNGTIREMRPEEVEALEAMAAQFPALGLDTPTQLDRVEAQAMYTALMTDTLLEEDE